MYKLKVGLFLGPEQEIMKFVHKQNIGYFLSIVVLLNQTKKPLFLKYQFYPF